MLMLNRIMFVLCAIATGLTSAWGQESVAIGSRVELFVDSYLIDRLVGAEQRLHPPTEGETVIAFDKPWEGRFCGYVTVIKDGDTYRLYYRGNPTAGKDGSTTEVTCYAESADGIAFTKPNLGLFEVDGTRENNVILANMAPFSHNFSPFLDTRKDVPAEERFKALAGTRETGLVAFVSPDGTTWKKMREEPVITDGAFDSQNVAFWSEAEGQYVSYFRVFSDGFRSISRTTSPDFREWSKPVEMTYGDTPREHLYTNQTAPYFRAPHIYVSIAARFMPGRRIVSEEQAKALGGDVKYSGDCSDAIFMTTRGGSAYDRTFMEGYIRPGLGLNNWTSRTNYPAYGVVPASDTEMSVYVQRNYGQDSHHLQRLRLQTDGFVSINAPYEGGELVTKPFTFDGNELAINFATSAAGSVWIELQNADGSPIDGFSREDCDEIVGDEIARVVTWKGSADVSSLAGKPVRLCAVMKDADLYSIQFRAR
ncbi:MAG: hypothetical protein KJ060_02530 [Candidatus Hydrogenedentes bacterium]|nr:hypothetical protein [Candidatus Hydrogenedentota bacterium]